MKTVSAPFVNPQLPLPVLYYKQAGLFADAERVFQSVRATREGTLTPVRRPAEMNPYTFVPTFFYHY